MRMQVVLTLATLFAQRVLHRSIGQRNAMRRAFLNQTIQYPIYGYAIASGLQLVINLCMRQCRFGHGQHFNDS